MYGKLGSTLVVVLLLAAVAGRAVGQGERAELSMPFKSTAPATQTGLDMDLRYYDPENRDEKPPTVSRLAIHLPEGTRLDPSALPACEASDQELQARGRNACPPETKVGEGKLEAYLGGPGDPQSTDVVLYNGPGQIIELILFEGTNNTAALERLKVEGTTISANPAQVPPAGPPDRRVSASKILWNVPPNGRYLVTPPSCPGDGLWRTRGEFEFADGSTARTESTQACARSAEPPPENGAPLLFTARVSPTRIVLGRRSRIRVRVVTNSPRCLPATVRVGRRSARTDEQGRATLVALVRYLARPRLRVSSPCGTHQLRLVARRR